MRVVAFTTLAQVAVGFDQMLTGMGHRLVGIVTTPGPAQRRSTNYLDLVAAVRPDLDIVVSSHPQRLPALVAPFKPDLILCGSFPWRIPAAVLALPRFGAINGHPAALPKYRGPNAVGWAFRNGDTELGFTAHRMDADFDTGPILAQFSVPIGDNETAADVFPQLLPIAAALYPQAVARVLAGDPGTPQDPALASDAPLFTPEQREIDWSQPARTVHNIVRGWHGMVDLPLGAFADVAGVRTLIMRTQLIDAPATSAVPGTLLERNNLAGTFVVQCGDGPLLVIAARPAGE